MLVMLSIATFTNECVHYYILVPCIVEHDILSPTAGRKGELSGL